jgi:hypothetical protein
MPKNPKDETALFNVITQYPPSRLLNIQMPSSREGEPSETDKALNSGKGFLLLCADCLEFQPETYHGLYFHGIKGAIFETGDLVTDVKAARSYRDEHLPSLDIVYSSSVDDYLSDRKDRKYMYDIDGSIIVRTPEKEAESNAYWNAKLG